MTKLQLQCIGCTILRAQVKYISKSRSSCVLLSEPEASRTDHDRGYMKGCVIGVIEEGLASMNPDIGVRHAR